MIGLTLAQPAAHAQSLPLPLVQSGTVERLAGTVRLSGGGGERIAAIKSPVYEGERIVTEAGSETVLRMADGALIALRPNSQISLVKYTFTPDPKDARADGATIQLVTGALRAITGVMGRRNPASVAVRTANATIGVR
ncbi:MAG TPA: FecR domain-containing protein, partial [Burkholderiaceae bacterium]|nr:FecR domain-containing protein [Burkholderiaceae bacterium]